MRLHNITHSIFFFTLLAFYMQGSSFPSYSSSRYALDVVLLTTLKSFPCWIQPLQDMTCHLYLSEDHITGLELSCLHFPIVILSCFLFAYGSSYFFNQVKIGYKVLRVLLIEGLSSWARNFDFYQDYYFMSNPNIKGVSPVRLQLIILQDQSSPRMSSTCASLARSSLFFNSYTII